VAAELEEQSALRTPAPQTDVRQQRYLRAARHHLKAGDPGRSRALCEELLVTSPPSSVRARALHQLAETWVVEQREAAIPLLEEALACVGEDPGYAALLEIGLGLVFGAGIDWQRAYPHLIRAVELAEQAGDCGLIAGAIATKALAELFSGQGLDEKALE